MSTIDYDRSFKTFPRRRWSAHRRIPQQRATHRPLFRDETTGDWYTAESWKRPNLRRRLTAEQVAYIQSIL
jgi:hypothetical protein